MNDKSESDFRIVTLRIDGVSVDKLSLSDIGPTSRTSLIFSGRKSTRDITASSEAVWS